MREEETNRPRSVYAAVRSFDVSTYPHSKCERTNPGKEGSPILYEFLELPFRAFIQYSHILNPLLWSVTWHLSLSSVSMGDLTTTSYKRRGLRGIPNYESLATYPIALSPRPLLPTNATSNGYSVEHSFATGTGREF